MYINFLNVLLSKIRLIHKIIMFAMYTPWETLENLWYTLPHSPLHICFMSTILTLIILFTVIALCFYFVEIN